MRRRVKLRNKTNPLCVFHRVGREIKKYWMCSLNAVLSLTELVATDSGSVISLIRETAEIHHFLRF